MPPDPTPDVNQPKALRSDFAADPDMREIIELFVQEMPSRVRDLQCFWDRQELEKVGRLAHQLKGAGGGYGFGKISEAAAKLEKSVASLKGAPTATVLEEMKTQVEMLADLCSRASAR